MPAKTTERSSVRDILQRAQKVIDAPIDIDDQLLKMGVRENSAPARRLATCDQTNPRRAQTWRRLAALMFTLAPGRPRMVQRAIQFYIPDGKYQLQVFALDDAQDGTLMICCEDVLATGIEAKLLSSQRGEPNRYIVGGSPHAIIVEQIDGKTENPPAFVNAMTGWNRKALKITLPSDAAKEQIKPVELLIAISSLRWEAKTA